MRKISFELKREIVDLGGAENITELRLRKKAKDKALKSSGLADDSLVRKLRHIHLIEYISSQDHIFEEVDMKITLLHCLCMLSKKQYSLTSSVLCFNRDL